MLWLDYINIVPYQDIKKIFPQNIRPASEHQPMHMNEKEFDQRFQWLYPHLEETGRQLRVLHRNRNFKIGIKDDGTKVTDADERLNTFWKSLIQQNFPGETIVSEEDPDSHLYREQTDPTWYVDPIDGTGKFIDGLKNYFVLISLCQAGKAVFGILYQPERNIVLYGNNHIRARIYSKPDEYREIHRPMSWRHRMPLIVKGAPPILRNELESVTHLNVKRTSNASHNIISPLISDNTGYISFRKTAYWDISAPAAIMESAGFKTGQFRFGEPAGFNDGYIYCDRFYALPADTPENVISYISTVAT